MASDAHTSLAMPRVLLFAVLSLSCTTPYEDPPRVQISLEHPIAADSVTTVTVAATKGDGAPGTGSVHLTASQGVLSEGPDLALVAGVATTTLTCTGCRQTLTFVAQWSTTRSETVVEVIGKDGG